MAAPGFPTGNVTSELGIAVVRPTAGAAAPAGRAVSTLSAPATVMHAAVRVACFRGIVASFPRCPEGASSRMAVNCASLLRRGSVRTRHDGRGSVLDARAHAEEAHELAR